MTPEETAAWAGTLFPGEVGLGSVTPPGGDPVMVARIGDSAAAEHAYMTIGLADVDQGLVTPDGRDLRSELVLRTAAHWHQGPYLLAVCAQVIAAHDIEVRPGAMIADAVTVVDPDLPVRHVLLREPRLWPLGTPRIDRGERVTTVLEVVPLTEDEWQLAYRGGVSSLTELLEIAEPPLADLDRESIA